VKWHGALRSGKRWRQPEQIREEAGLRWSILWSHKEWSRRHSTPFQEKKTARGIKCIAEAWDASRCRLHPARGGTESNKGKKMNHWKTSGSSLSRVEGKVTSSRAIECYTGSPGINPPRFWPPGYVALIAAAFW
jgi:hypothetical protein